MPSFLNKVFGYKKHDDKEVARPTRDASDNTLLDGKYEAIPPILSPSAATFAEAQAAKDPDRDIGFSLFKPKSRGVSQKPAQKHLESLPHLTLQLPGPKGNPDSRALGIVFEADPNSQAVLDDAVIAAKHLSPLEALILVRACAQAITERGLETLGLMHPHWLSASPDVQRKLISLFIRSLTPQSRITTLSPTPSSSASAFENELHYTRSPHDVAAVLRWGLRHLALEDGHFGKDAAEWAWYNSFFHAERNASYPPKAFSELLLPQLPASHIELLTATLSLISSLASHAEANSISGSKLSKFWGLWLLLATRAEQSDDWNRFYARWERAGRILEHLFLARLREESFEQRLPPRLQELVKYYPYNEGSPSTADDLLCRPRFSTRRYDALFVRVEAVLTHSAEQPKQHPIQLLLEAFQIPVENPSGDEHIAFWNTLKTTAFEEATSSDPEGLQFARIFVDETIQLLSLIPADNSTPTSPALLTSPITKVVSRKRSSSLTKVLERAFPKLGAINGSTPVSPTSPSSPVITDWTQFSMSGFGDIPTTQPLAVLLDQEDVEVTQPRMSRKSSRQRGKSRTRRRRSEDREPLDTPLSSQPEAEPSIVETKLRSVHVVQIDEAFIDFWSDAIVDPISANWPTFVVCGLKQIPSAEQPIRWLVIEQTYSRQQPQPPRVPSPDGHRGRSPRPSFRSDISGFRINTMFSSARKRFSVFSKSATDLDPKRSGGKNLITGELGEVLVEEEPTLPSAPPTQVDHHVNGNAPVAAVVTSDATAGVADQLKADEIFTASIAAVPSADPMLTLKEESDPIQVAVEAPSVEPTPKSGGRFNGSSEVPPWPVKASEEAVSVEQGSSRTPDAINPKVDNTANPVAKIAPLAADTPHSWSTQGTSDPTVPASGPVLTAEDPIAEIQTEQRVTVEAEDRPVELAAQPAESTSGPSDVVQVDVADGLREVAEDVAIPSALETVAVVVATPAVAAVHDEVPEPTAEEPHVVEESPRKASADLVAASAVKSVGQQEIDDLASVSAVNVQEKIIVTEARARLEPDSIASVVDGVEEAEVAEVAEIPTPVPELVALVEETPGPEVPVAACAAESVVEGAAHQPMAAESQATLEPEESSITQPVQAPSLVGIVPAVDTSAQAVTVGTERGADQVPDLDAQHVVQGPIIQAAEADISAGTVTAGQESEDVSLVKAEPQTAAESFVSETGILETQAHTPVPEHAVLVDDTPGPETAAEAYESVEAAPVIALESGAVEVNALEPEAEAIVEGAELPTRVADVQPMEALSTKSIPKAATPASATADEIIAVNAQAQPTPDAPAEDAQVHTPAPIRVTPEFAIDEPAEPIPITATDAEPVENKATEPATEEAQVLVEHAAPSASEPVATTHTVIIEEPVTQDVQAPIEIEGPSSESTSQSVDAATNHPTVIVSAPEEVIAVEAEAQLEPAAVHPTADTVDGTQAVAQDAEPDSLASEVRVTVEATREVVDTSESVTLAAEPEVDGPAPVEAEELSQVVVEVAEEGVVSQPDVAPVVEMDETSGIDGPQKLVDLQPAASDIEVSTHEPAGL